MSASRSRFPTCPTKLVSYVHLSSLGRQKANEAAYCYARIVLMVPYRDIVHYPEINARIHVIAYKQRS